MAKAASGETKAPLVIALVFFVLSTIGLGVFAYTTNEDLTAAKNAEKEAGTKAKSSDDNAQKAREEALIYKAALGVANEKDRESFAGIRFKAEAAANFKAMEDAINAKAAQAIGSHVKDFAGGGAAFSATPSEFLQWTWPAGADAPQMPAGSVLDNAVAFRAQKEINDRTTKVTLDDAKAKTVIMIAKTGEKDEQQKQFRDKTAAIPAQVAAGVAKEKEGYDDKVKQFQGTQSEARNNVQNATDKMNESELQLKRSRDTITTLDRRITAMLDREFDLIDPFQFDKPQGKVLRRYSDSLIDIDLGGSDKLRPGMAFSIFPSDTIVRGMQPRMRPFKDADGKQVFKPIPKGKIEVIDVIGPNIAQCRIVDEDNAVRDRIIPGDLLYNALWRKGVGEHVALFGVFDLDGDGRDDTQALIAGLRRVGVVVDAYYDLSTMKWVGELTSQTTFAIEGYSPTVSAADGNMSGKLKVTTAIAECRRSVKDKGILILRPRDAFPRIGFNARLDVNEDAINQAATNFSRGQIEGKPADAKPMEGDPKPEAKPEKN